MAAEEEEEEECEEKIVMQGEPVAAWERHLRKEIVVEGEMERVVEPNKKGRERTRRDKKE